MLMVFSTPTSLVAWEQHHRTLRNVGTIILLVGVALEVLIDNFWTISYPPLLRGRKATTVLKKKAEKWKLCVMPFVGLGLVFGGIALEWWQSTLADDDADQIQAHLELAQVATEAELEPRRGFASMPEYDWPRHPAVKQAKDKLKSFSGERVWLIQEQCDDCDLLAAEIHDTLVSDKWSVVRITDEQIGLNPFFIKEIGFGVAIFSWQLPKLNWEAAETLTQFLKLVGTSATHFDFGSEWKANSKQKPPPGVILVVVDSRPISIELGYLRIQEELAAEKAK